MKCIYEGLYEYVAYKRFLVQNSDIIWLCCKQCSGDALIVNRLKEYQFPDHQVRCEFNLWDCLFIDLSQGGGRQERSDLEDASKTL